jgi:crossover junction endodeoxyribonuclease RuvC
MIIGVDPGVTGAISYFSNNGELLGVRDLPTMALGKKKQINAAGLSRLLDYTQNHFNSPRDAWFDEKHCLRQVAYLEKVNAMPGQGVSSMFNFGMGYGVIQGVLAANNIPLHLVTPQSWKKHHGLIGKDKECARTLAIQKFPAADLHLKKHIGRADAILIGQYGLHCEQGV